MSRFESFRLRSVGAVLAAALGSAAYVGFIHKEVEGQERRNVEMRAMDFAITARNEAAIDSFLEDLRSNDSPLAFSIVNRSDLASFAKLRAYKPGDTESCSKDFPFTVEEGLAHLAIVQFTKDSGITSTEPGTFRDELQQIENSLPDKCLGTD